MNRIEKGSPNFHKFGLSFVYSHVFQISGR